MFQFNGHVRRVHSELSSDRNLDMSETRFTAERAHETRVRYRQILHGERLPVPRVRERRIFASLRGQSR